MPLTGAGLVTLEDDISSHSGSRFVKATVFVTHTLACCSFGSNRECLSREKFGMS